MLINLSNHPSDNWTAKQFSAAKKKYGRIIDLPFPRISPNNNSIAVEKKANLYLSKCLKLIAKSSEPVDAVHIMGELTFTFAFVSLAKQKNIKCIASTTSRISRQNGYAKTSIFTFISFREY